MKRQLPKEVQELLGHSGVAITLDTCSYVILDREEGDDAMEEHLLWATAATGFGTSVESL